MKKHSLIILILPSLLMCSCNQDNKQNKDPEPKDKLISLSNESSKYYMRRLEDADTISSLRTYHRKEMVELKLIINFHLTIGSN